jgi:hypothetical protein
MMSSHNRERNEKITRSGSFDDHASPEAENMMSNRQAALSLPASAGKIDLDPENVKNGIAQLILTLIKLLHELLERQAIRRMDAGSLSDEEVERLGLALLKQAQEIDRIRKEFGLEEEDLNLDLGPLGKLL